jgi:hypothetical protein
MSLFAPAITLPPGFSDNLFLGAGTARCNTGPAAAGTICQESYLWGLELDENV